MLSQHGNDNQIEIKNTADNAPYDFSIGSFVEARYNGKEKYFKAQIMNIRYNGTYDLKYEDGSKERAVEVKFLQQFSTRKDEPESTALFRKGMAVQVNYRKLGNWYSGVISCERTDGTYNIEYDGGGSEIRVSEDRIKLSSNEPSATNHHTVEVSISSSTQRICERVLKPTQAMLAAVEKEKNDSIADAVERARLQRAKDPEIKLTVPEALMKPTSSKLSYQKELEEKRTSNNRSSSPPKVDEAIITLSESILKPTASLIALQREVEAEKTRRQQHPSRAQYISPNVPENLLMPTIAKSIHQKEWEEELARRRGFQAPRNDQPVNIPDNLMMPTESVQSRLLEFELAKATKADRNAAAPGALNGQSFPVLPESLTRETASAQAHRELQLSDFAAQPAPEPLTLKRASPIAGKFLAPTQSVVSYKKALSALLAKGASLNENVLPEDDEPRIPFVATSWSLPKAFVPKKCDNPRSQGRVFVSSSLCKPTRSIAEYFKKVEEDKVRAAAAAISAMALAAVRPSTAPSSLSGSIRSAGSASAVQYGMVKCEKCETIFRIPLEILELLADPTDSFPTASPLRSGGGTGKLESTPPPTSTKSTIRVQQTTKIPTTSDDLSEIEARASAERQARRHWTTHKAQPWVARPGPGSMSDEDEQLVEMVIDDGFVCKVCADVIAGESSSSSIMPACSSRSIRSKSGHKSRDRRTGPSSATRASHSSACKGRVGAQESTAAYEGYYSSDDSLGSPSRHSKPQQHGTTIGTNDYRNTRVAGSVDPRDGYVGGFGGSSVGGGGSTISVARSLSGKFAHSESWKTYSAGSRHGNSDIVDNDAQQAQAEQKKAAAWRKYKNVVERKSRMRLLSSNALLANHPQNLAFVGLLESQKYAKSIECRSLSPPGFTIAVQEK